jgi:hypothetical protein
MRRIVAPTMSRPTSLCWSHVLPVSAAAVAVRKLIVALVGELHASEKWAGIALRPPPDPATLADSRGSCAAFERSNLDVLPIGGVAFSYFRLAPKDSKCLFR